MKSTMKFVLAITLLVMVACGQSKKSINMRKNTN